MKDTLEVLQYEELKKLVGQYIQTKYGKLELERVKPVFDIEKVKAGFDTLNDFFGYFIKWGGFSLKDVFVKDIISDAFQTTLDEKQLKDVGDFLREIALIKDEFYQHDPELFNRHINFDIPALLLDEITKAIDEYGFIRDSASARLFKIRESRRQTSQNIKRILKNLMHSRLKDVLIDTAIFLRHSRFTLLLKPNFKEYIGGRIVDISKSGGFFVEPDTVFKENSLLEDLIAQEEAERRRILSYLTQLVRENANRLKYDENVLGVLDLLLAKFYYSRNLPEYEIEFSDRPIIFAKGVRHPILASLNKDTKPVDIDLKSDSKLVVTGPNTGGKTVFLKTIGLLFLAIFSIIPPNAEYVEIGKFDNIFAIIGDEQDIFESLSGFSSKIISFRSAFKIATPNSLILIDEVGSGTSPDEGEAIAYAIIREAAKKCVFCATTHYKRLAYILQSEGFPIAAFEFDTKTLKPTYRLNYGRVGKSYGIDILKTLSVDEEIIKEAVEFYKNNSTVFSRLEVQMQKMVNFYYRKKEELEVSKRLYLELIEKGRKENENLIEKLKREELYRQKKYKELMDVLKKEVSILMRTKNVPRAHRKINEIRKKAEEIFKEKPLGLLEYGLKVGDTVSLDGVKGKILSIRGYKATIEAQGKVVVVPLGRLRRLDTEEKNEQVKVYANAKSTSLELNIIGERRDEAHFKLMKFLDSMSLESVKTVRIVHGVGSGILKDMVWQTLSEFPYVKKFYPAHPNEGGSGVTIVELT